MCQLCLCLPLCAMTSCSLRWPCRTVPPPFCLRPGAGAGADAGAGAVSLFPKGLCVKVLGTARVLCLWGPCSSWFSKPNQMEEAKSKVMVSASCLPVSSGAWEANGPWAWSPQPVQPAPGGWRYLRALRCPGQGYLICHFKLKVKSEVRDNCLICFFFRLEKLVQQVKVSCLIIYGAED